MTSSGLSVSGRFRWDQFAQDGLPGRERGRDIHRDISGRFERFIPGGFVSGSSAAGAATAPSGSASRQRRRWRHSR